MCVCVFPCVQRTLKDSDLKISLQLSHQAKMAFITSMSADADFLAGVCVCVFVCVCVCQRAVLLITCACVMLVCCGN